MIELASDGSDPKLASEVVMLGGHFDGWHAGTGATDNAAGSAVMMEALRILKASGLKMKRTVRIGNTQTSSCTRPLT